MGCNFDSLWIACPVCSKSMEFQSKSGGCSMMHYTLIDAPMEIMADIIGARKRCSCGAILMLKGSVSLNVEVLPSVLPRGAVD